MQHPELSHPKFLLRYLSTLGLEPSTNQSVSTRWRPEGHNSESRLARRFEWTALGARPTRTKGKGGKDDKGKGGKDDKGKGGKGGWGGGKGGLGGGKGGWGGVNGGWWQVGWGGGKGGWGGGNGSWWQGGWWHKK